VIVECSNCQTRFQLDDSRVPLRGIRVRCSRCKEAFFLEHPDAIEAEAVHDVAGEAAAGAPPDSTQDLPPQTSMRDSDGSSHEPDEEDWEFNDDLPGDDAPADEGPGPDVGEAETDDFDDDFDDEDIEAAANEAAVEDDVQVPGLGVDGMSADEEDDADSGLDLDAGSDSGVDLGGSEPSHDNVISTEEEASSDFGEVSDFSALADDDDDDGPIVTESAEPAAAPAASASAEPQDVGEPEDWDFFSDESLEQPSSMKSMESMDNALGHAMAAVEADEPGNAFASDGPDLGNVKLEPRSRLGGLRSVGRAAGWTITLALFGVGLAGGVLGVSTPAGQRVPAAVDLGDFQAQQVRGSWFETLRSTQLYAVTGRLVNDSSQVRWPGAGLTVALLSEDGQSLELAARAGVPLGEEQLRELAPDDLAWALEQSVTRLAQVRLEPGQSVPFQAFFDGIPDQATSFVLEMEDVAPPPSAYAPLEAGVLDPLGEALDEAADGRLEVSPELADPGLAAANVIPANPAAGAEATPRASDAPARPSSQALPAGSTTSPR
jgi:predicted Zn finger-like uncharacterized protein